MKTTTLCGDKLLRTQVGNVVVSTVAIVNSKWQEPHLESAVFECDTHGRIRDWMDLYMTRSYDLTKMEQLHDETLAWACGRVLKPLPEPEPNSQGAAPCDEAEG